jgi:hypothetical protein
MAISCRSTERWPALLALLPLLLFGCATVESFPSPAQRPQISGIAGQVTGATARPAGGAHVYAYRSARSGLRGPADFEALVQEDGSYHLDLAAGEYHLVARGRRQGADSGPMRAGDSWAAHAANPVQLVDGELLHIDFHLQEMVPSRQLRDGQAAGKKGYRGRLVDERGQAVSGAYVFAYRPGAPRQPDFSAAAGADGRFTLFVAAPGSYCLIARTQLRGQPLRGELLGHLDHGEPGCRAVQADEILDLGAIVLRPYHP